MLDKLGISSLRIDLPFRLNHVNCFLARGEKEWSILDTGLHTKNTIAAWDACLAGRKVEDIYISHYHPDHFGYAGALQQQTNARVWMTEVDQASGVTVWQEGFLQELQAHYRLAGVPPERALSMTQNTESFQAVLTPYPTVDHLLVEGQRILFGHYEYEVIATPGHSDGLVVFYNKDQHVLLSTDHILPTITPNVAYWFHGIDNPLEAYLQSLMKIQALDVQYVIPSHGEPFYNANQRIDDILHHHAERLSFVMDVVGKGITPYALSEKLFDKQLDVHEQRFALGETIAHLEYLWNKGELSKELRNGCWWYLTK